MVILGQGDPSGLQGGKQVDSSVHGQPCLSRGGGGSSLKVGQRIVPIEQWVNA